VRPLDWKLRGGNKLYNGKNKYIYVSEEPDMFSSDTKKCYRYNYRALTFKVYFVTKGKRNVVYTKFAIGRNIIGKEMSTKPILREK
jgi:hypothetical protein